MSLNIIYDDEAETLSFTKDDFTICTTSVKAFNSVYSRNFTNLQAALIPPAVRQVVSYRDKTYIFYEERPQYRQVQFTPEKLEELNLDAEGVYNYYLPMPWLLFVIELSMGNEIMNIYGYVAKPQPLLIDYRLFQIPIHNWYSNCILCRPMYNNESIQKHTDLLSIINQVHNEVWCSGFNNDLRDTVDHYALHASNFTHSFITSEQKKTLKMLQSGDRDILYNFYYTAWANAPMERMLKANYNSVGTVADVFGHLFCGEEPTLDTNQFASELLIAAQNALILK